MKKDRPLREHFETETDAGTALQTFRYIEALENYIDKNQIQPIEKEQTNLFEIKKQVALDMGFDLNTDVYKIHFSDYTDEIAKRFASWKLKEQEQEIERLKVDNANLKTNVEYASLAFATLDNEYKELEAQKECNHEALTDTSIGYYHCPTCNKGWTYDEWNKQDQPEAQKPPQKEKFGWEDTTSFDNQGGWTIEGGEEAYYEALAAWEHIKHAKPEQQNQPQPEKAQEEQSELSFDAYCKLIGSGPFNEPAHTIYKTLMLRGYIITRQMFNKPTFKP